MSWLTLFLPGNITFAKLFVYGFVFFFIVTHCPMW